MEPFNDPIAAIATAAGPGAIGIVRLSGKDLTGIAKALFGPLPKPRTLEYRTIVDQNGAALDAAVILFFEGPRSFTGEHVLEIQTHGGATVPQAVLQAALAAGARLAEPGEFSKRAFLNGKIDLIQAEAIADLIQSSSIRAARSALHSLSGDFSADVEEIGRRIKHVRVQLEAGLDFPDEDIDPGSIDHLVELSQSCAHDLARLLDKAETGIRLNHGIDVAIIGRPNAGKSTLLNAIARVDRAIVTPQPGTTRDVLSVDVDLNGIAVRVHDTAGIRDSADLIEREGVSRALDAAARADVIFHVTDNDEDEPPAQVKNLLKPGIPVFTIRNKIDLHGLQPAIENRKDGLYILLSAKNRDGIELLHDALTQTFHLSTEADSAYLARTRHLSALTAARDALSFDHAELYRRLPELATEHLRVASLELSKLLGEYTTEEMLGDIFSTFCIGK